MKEILIRNLDSPAKGDIRQILLAYLERDYIGTSALSTAVEQLIREFNSNETQHKETVDAQKTRIKELEVRLKELARQNQLFQSKQTAFALALNNLLVVEPLL
ncbi:hypothetical protein ACS5NO_32380 [Larkinella sp. GY13]|uniref:hypothetical protein n=1 Tax=Larkinella sp. GY13 TaxID=3453720 RepID=UPI003EE981B7